MVMKRALIIGTYVNAAYHHPFQGVDQQLVKALEGAFEVRLTDDLNELKDLTGYDLLVSYLDNLPAQWPEGVADSVSSFVRAGGGLLLLHYGICLSTLEPLLGLIGGRFDHHPPQEPLTFTPSPDGFLSALEGFTISEEPYQFQLAADDLKTILEYEYRGERYIGGWQRTEGQGRVVYLAPGHSVETFRLAAYRVMIKAAALWAVNTK